MNAKRLAAEKAVTYIDNGMVVGLGTGSTAYYAIHHIAKRVQEGLRIHAVASSKQSETLARELQIPIIPFSDIETIDISIDGADEVDPRGNLIKGGGGALLREKILAVNSNKFIVIVDDSKVVPQLGKFPLPVEIVPFAFELTMGKLNRLGSNGILRMQGDQPFVTDNGNYIVDCHMERIADAARLSEQLHAIPGVVEHGLFIQLADTIIVGSEEGAELLNRNGGQNLQLPAGLAKPAQRALAGAGIGNLEQLAKLSESELNRLHGIGPNAVRQLRQAMEHNGLSFR
ncbi:ribose 5-phosphate isomerase [Paenibacillus curdlanolyticus YK9]|uniref:Ribose-5-phosphate isomerase A n=1 Tax=Paenibacillus curdlanolyticus YK9 TaxID=717606 RepID=E0ICR0_9BACL|nr:ribose-5-phosphate isomerase RpiA [Paenibacillus curdlanolyticus]EFM09946.1 ribose 5-phosphate isomerase [Paenibacillus curdlanolyticus YK9]